MVAHTVAWTVQRRAGWHGALARVVELVAALLNARTQGWSFSPMDAELPTDTGTVLNVDIPLVRGRASFLPCFEDGAGVPLEVYGDRAPVTVPRDVETVEMIVPLRKFTVVGHRRLSGRWSPTGPTARWELVLASENGDEQAHGHERPDSGMSGRRT
jgi:hypothetical protein